MQVSEKTIASEAGHWYDRHGNPCYTIIGKNGNERPTTLRDARKLDLVPSVTGIIRTAAAPGLENWKQDQILMAALTCPHIEGESNEEWKRRIIKDAKEQAEKAREKGVAIHAAIEQAYNSDNYDRKYNDFVEATICAIYDHTWILYGWHAENTFCHPAGYGGKVDLSGDGWVIDFKTKEFGADKKAKDLVYDEHLMQLAACREGLKMPDARCLNVFISTSNAGLVLIHEWSEDDLQRGFQMFMSLLNYWKAKNKV